MRVHIDRTPRPWEVEVYLNGAKLKNCFAADSCRGWAKCWSVGGDGKLMLDSDGLHEVIMFGRVTLRRVERAAA